MTPFNDRSIAEQVGALARLAKAALANYEGKFSEPEIVKYRENAVFSVRRDDGERFALRIHRPGYHSHEALVSELSWMRSLAAQGVPVPDVQLNLEGQAITLARTDGVPEQRRIDLLGWIDGTPLSTLEEAGELGPAQRRDLYRATGSLTAMLHDHAANWREPARFERHAWFADALIGEEPLWGRFWTLPCLTATQKDLLNLARREAETALGRHCPGAGNSGLIHADLIADNLMVGGGQVRPIDFDDAGYGWHIFDIATTLYFLADDPHYPDLRDALISGYQEVRPLTQAELDALPLFLMLRGTTYLGWVASRSETPTARDLTPDLVDRCCKMCRTYLDGN